MAVSKRLRYEILRRDNHACRYCGQMAPDVKLTVDHVVPVSLGGGDAPENLVAACIDCNAGKSSTPADAALVADVSAAAMRYRYAIMGTSEVFTQEVEQLEAERDAFRESWDAWKDGNNKPLPIPGTWQGSIDRFVSSGLTQPILRECVRIAMSRPNVGRDDVFRYFCGVAWGKVREMQEVAVLIADRMAAEDEAVAVDGA